MRQETMLELRDLIWSYRQRLADRWPTPPPVDALRFAFTEAAEAMDAWLRLQPAYNRNNAKELSVEDELSDCLMMLVTALGPEWQPPPVTGIYAATLEGICSAVAECMLKAAYNSADWSRLTTCAVVKIDCYLEADPVTLVRGRLERIERRVSGAAN